MRLKHFEESVYIIDIMLSICVECDYKIPTMVMSIATNIGKSCLECCSSSSINQVMNIYNFLPKMLLDKNSRIIKRSIIYDQNLIKSMRNNPLDHTDDSSCFIIGANEEDNLIFLHDVFFPERFLV